MFVTHKESVNAAEEVLGQPLLLTVMKSQQTLLTCGGGER
jgi:hypothetical protein